MSKPFYSLNSDKLSAFDRLISKDGFYEPIANMYFKDINDVDAETRQNSKKFIREHLVYSTLINQLKAIKLGNALNRRFGIYGWYNGRVVGSIVYTEILDNPHGYGRNDFKYTKIVFPEFTKSRQSRSLTACWMHCLFLSGLANRTYAYVRRGNSEGFVLDQLDPTLPCLSIRYERDNPNYLTYVSIPQYLQINGARFVILELDGNKYRNMDFEHYMQVSGMSAKKARNILYELDRAVGLVKEEISKNG